MYKAESKVINFPLEDIKQIASSYSDNSKVYVNFSSEMTSNGQSLEAIGEVEFLIQRIKMIKNLNHYVATSTEAKNLQEMLLNPHCYPNEISEYENVFFSKKEILEIKTMYSLSKNKLNTQKLQSIMEKYYFENELNTTDKQENKKPVNKI
jgi:hypothetical protein